MNLYISVLGPDDKFILKDAPFYVEDLQSISTELKNGLESIINKFDADRHLMQITDENSRHLLKNIPNRRMSIAINNKVMNIDGLFGKYLMELELDETAHSGRFGTFKIAVNQSIPLVNKMI